MVNWNSRMIRRKGQAITSRLQVESVKNNDGVREVTFSIPNLPDGYTVDPIVMRFTPDADEDAMADAVQPEEGAEEPDEGSDGDVDAKGSKRNRK